MGQRCPIYGFEFTRPFTAGALQFEPLYTSYQVATAKARDARQYNLTGVVSTDRYDSEVMFRLEAILSFIEHLDVAIGSPSALSAGNTFEGIPEVARVADRHSGGGAVVADDAFFPDSRRKFVELALAKLSDDAHCHATGYRTLFFKATETFRQRRPFLEVSYFLLFSGLETYVRRTLGDPHSRDIAQLLNKRLRQLGFQVYDYRPTELERSMDTYARLRNALFHASDFQAVRKARSGTVHYKLLDYFAQFMLLVNLVVLKATDFDDGHINWDSWIDRQIFI
jgi:hypothetical protein